MEKVKEKDVTTKILRLGPWGYSMTLNNFYVVLSETKHRAKIRDIGSRCVEDRGGYSGMEVPAFVENVNNKEYTVMRTEQPDGSVIYRGKAGLHRTYELKVVQHGESFYFNHCD